MKMQKCSLCSGTGENRTGRDLSPNNHICPQCGGYGSFVVETPRIPGWLLSLISRLGAVDAEKLNGSGRG
jgi:hypothetical protein